MSCNYQGAGYGTCPMDRDDDVELNFNAVAFMVAIAAAMVTSVIYTYHATTVKREMREAQAATPSTKEGTSTGVVEAAAKLARPPIEGRVERMELACTSPACEIPGCYSLPNESLLCIERSRDGFVIGAEQLLLSLNADRSVARHPKLPSTPLRNVRGEIMGSYAPEYEPSMNVKDDRTSEAITGRRLTVYRIYKNMDNKLVVRLSIFSDQGMNLVTRRFIIER